MIQMFIYDQNNFEFLKIILQLRGLNPLGPYTCYDI